MIKLLGPVCHHAKVLLFFAVFFLGVTNAAWSQSLLDQPISISLKQQRLTESLKEIARKGNFYFSYNGNLFSKDSLIDVEAHNQPIREILNHLLGNGKYELEEKDNYVIITLAQQRLQMIDTDMSSEHNTYSASGIVINERTRERLANVSVYEKRLLVATLTDDHGYFHLRFKATDPGVFTLTASKVFYRDTTISFLKTVIVTSNVENSRYANSRNRSRVEQTGLGRLFISTRQKIQSMNIPDFFARRPFQISISPGLSSHGTFSSQVVNKFSLNLAGGYTAGTDGLEIGGLFNINKGEAKYLQLAGAFNLVGGNMTGLQLAGAHNGALDTVRGVQLSLFTNDAENQLSGLQISALHNYTGHLKGVQIGLINVADSSDGTSVGVLNIVRNGFYKISYSINDLANTNITLKTGTHRFYSTLLTSVNVSDKNKFFAFGLGIGHDFMLSDIWYFSAETNYQFAYTGSLTDRWIQGKLIVNVQLSKSASLFAGPTYNRYSYTGSQSGFQSKFRLPKDYVVGDRNPVKVWTGWEAGIAFNSIFKPASKNVDNSAAWYIGLAGSGGFAWDQPYGFVSGAEISLQRDLGANLTGTITTGYTHFSARENYLFSRLGDIYFYAKPDAIVPLNAGIRLKAGKRFYIGGDIGAAFGGKESRIVNKSPTSPAVSYPNNSYNSLMYGLSAGFMFKNGLEAGIKFEDYGLQSQYKQLALRLGYRIKLTN